MRYLNIIKRETKVMIIIVILLLMVVLGVSYALFMQVTDNTNNQVVTTGTLQVEYSSSNGYINGDTYNELLPMSNDLGLQQTGYEFSVKNTGNLPVTYNVFMYINYDSYNADKNSGAISGDLFEDLSLIKYNLQTNSDANTEINKLSEQTNKDENGIKKYNIYSGSVESNNSINTHKLRIWLDEDIDVAEIGKYIYLKLEVTSYVKGQEPKIICELSKDEDLDGVADIGDMVTCDTESFYVYNNDGETVKMLAQYNLEVGNSSNSAYPATTETYLQSSKALGTKQGYSTYSTVAFSNDEKHGVNYTNYEGSIVQYYVNKYADKLTEKNISFKNVGLITKEELELLGCSFENVTCSAAPKFIYETSYWTGTTPGSNVIYYVLYSGRVDNWYYYIDDTFGVRPTVQIATSEIKKSKEKNIVAAYTYNQESTAANYCVTGDEETCEETTCYESKEANNCASGTIITYKVNENDEVRFHVMYDNGSTMTLQSQKNTVYNVEWINAENYATANTDGTSCSYDSCNDEGPITILNALESTTSGWSNVNNQTYTMGTTTFKTNVYTECSSYSSCTSNKYTLPERTAKARMITVQEAADLGCTGTSESCPIWMYNYLQESTSYGGTINDTTTANGASYNNGYWTVNANSSFASGAWRVYYYGSLYNHYSAYVTDYGARAVVEINK